MRRLVLQVPAGQGELVIERALACDGVNLARLDGRGPTGSIELVFVHLPNDRVEDLLGSLDDLEELGITVEPNGILPLRPPVTEAGGHVLDVSARSPLEIVLAGMQASGTWTSFIGFAVAAGIVVWIGLYTEAWYLLTAAMLIAPFAGPAMNTALGTARGDPTLLRHALLRYAVSLAAGALSAAALTLVVGQSLPTRMAVEVSQVSSVAFLLPLAAGFAGGLYLVQSEQSSLISGAAVGMLVAASLAPPVGVLGIGLVIGREDLLLRASYLLVLQLIGINLTAATIFRMYGVSTREALVGRGSPKVSLGGMMVTGLVLLAIVGLQFTTASTLQQGSEVRQIRQAIVESFAGGEVARLLDVDVRYSPLHGHGEEWLLVSVELADGDPDREAEMVDRLRSLIDERGVRADTAIDVTFFEGARGR